MNSNKVAVIGSNSFSGSHLVDYLIRNEYKVLGLSRSQQPKSPFLPYQWKKPSAEKNFNFIKADVNNDFNLIVQSLLDFKPDYIINFSAQGMVAESWLSPCDWYQTNVVSQVRLHDEMRKMDFLKKYVHFSTPEVYGSTDGWIKENFNFSPSTPYATSRAACDLHLMSFFKNYNFPVVFTRAANVFGPGQQLYRIVPRVVMSALISEPMNLHGGGLSERSFIDIRDTVSATVDVMQKGHPGETYHISTQDKISIKDLVYKVFGMMEIDPNNLVNITEERLGKDQAYLLKSDRIRSDFGWKESYTLNQTILETIDWAKENINILKELPLNYIHKT